MKKLLLVLVIFSVNSTYANALEEPQFESQCFAHRASFSVDSLETIKVETKEVSDLVFRQDEQYLKTELFQQNEPKFLEYTVESITGSQENTNLAFLNDSNTDTEVRFDPLAESERSLIIEMPEMMEEDSFDLQLNYVGSYEVWFYISPQGEEFFRVQNPEEFAWQYLRLEFRKNEALESFSENLAIKELNFLTDRPAVYLLKPITSGRVEAYRGYQCQSDNLQKIINYLDSLERPEFTLSSNTQSINLDFKANPRFAADLDSDGILNNEDNCPLVANFRQEDQDEDLIGDACDLEPERKNYVQLDSDQDNIANLTDNCPFVYNPKQIDSNADGRGDLCADDDQDGIRGLLDNCPNVFNPEQQDININAIGDSCEFDQDGDGVFDAIDNCINDPNPEQLDKDGDQIGDACDNCELFNPAQRDFDQSGVGDVCERAQERLRLKDLDEDGIIDSEDNCPNRANPEQIDKDLDNVGDACDNCREIQNSNQQDLNENGVGDACEDSDGDGIVGYRDNCPNVANADQQDQDNDGRGDVCSDADLDGFIFAEDNCSFVSNKSQKDIDSDGVGDACDDTDDRYLESNKGVVILITSLVIASFLGLIIILARKLKRV